jgi:Pel9A-like, right handed beta helix region
LFGFGLDASFLLVLAVVFRYLPASCMSLWRRASLLFAAVLLTCSARGAQFYNDWAAAHFSDIPSQSGTTNDPDGDGEPNIVEFAFGTDPRSGGGITDAVTPVFGSCSGTNGLFTVEILEREGHQPGVQIDLYLSQNMASWFRPWWIRSITNSHPSDPPGSIRESFTTRLPGTNVWFVRSSVNLIDPGPVVAKYYVATNGIFSNPGTNINQPTTLFKVASVANPGDLIYVRGGTYRTNITLTLSRNGAPGNPIRLRNYPGEHPILDLSPQAFGTRGINLSGRWWYIYGLEVSGAGDNGLNISGHSNVIELCVFHNCRDTGLQISSPGSSNLVLNCDSYRNFDTNPGDPNDPHGENADGFAPKLAGLGPKNVFRGCRAWENSDDGWDLFAAPNVVLIDSCWSFRNGSNVINDPGYTGDGNGFKLGGIDGTTMVPIAAPHRVINCIAFRNTHHGIDQNNNSAGQTLDNNTTWSNGVISGNNINLNHGAVTQGVHVVRNNISFAGTTSFAAGSLLTNNSWQLFVSPPVTNSDVLSLDTSWAQAPRRDDGGLPDVPFLRPVPTCRLIDHGVNAGLPFIGPTPDLGAFEAPAW